MKLPPWSSPSDSVVEAGMILSPLCDPKDCLQEPGKRELVMYV